MDKKNCRVCNIVIENADWGKVIATGYYDREENWGSTTEVKTSIRLYICPNCGAVFSDWDE